MWIVSLKAIRDFWTSGHAKAEAPLREWYKLAKAAEWSSLADVRKMFPSADSVMVESGKSVVVFNVGGNNYRLITAIHYNLEKVFILRVLTHAEYSKNKWKAQL
jgi:mRNA interferase HigB